MASDEDAPDVAGWVIALSSGTPRIHPTAWVAAGAAVVGNVALGPEVGVYYGAVLRAEGAGVTVGARSNVQDNCVLHAGLTHSVSVGERVTIGHSAVVHGCTVEDEVLIGMGAVLLNDCRIGAGSIVAAGALVPERMTVAPGSLVVGAPGRIVRGVTAGERAEITDGADHYLGLLETHRAGAHRARRPPDRHPEPAHAGEGRALPSSGVRRAATTGRHVAARVARAWRARLARGRYERR